jgi:hypothetical protein
MDGVLCRYRIERRLALLAAWSGHSAEAIHAAIWGSGFEDEAERGLLSVDDYLKGFGERMGYPLSAAQWVEARRAAMEPDQAVLALARLLRVARPVGMFTNNPWLLQRHIAEVFPRRPRPLRHAGGLLGRAGPEQAGSGGLPPPGGPSRVCARRDPLLRRRCHLCGGRPRGRAVGPSRRRSRRRACRPCRAWPPALVTA